MLVDVVSSPTELQRLLTRAQTIAEESTQIGDFNRARAYYDVTLPLARRLQQERIAQDLRLARAETYVTEALQRSTEMLRSMDLRLAVQALRQAGATRERRDQVDRLLDEAQTVSVTEMSTVGTPIDSENLARHTRALLRGQDSMKGLWLLAGAFDVPTVESVRTMAEGNLERHRFAFGFAQPHLSRDGRREGETPGALGADNDTFEQAVQGAMRFNASYARISAVFGIIEPGRQELVASHDYTLTEIQTALQSRPFIPHGHLVLWSKGIRAGLVGEFDVAVHLLAPQMENALRDVLRRHGESWYSTSSAGVQSVLSIETVLEQPKAASIFGADIIFALSTALAERLGANVRNEVAHGLITDGVGQSHEAAFVWWLALHMLRFYGPDALASDVATL